MARDIGTQKINGQWYRNKWTQKTREGEEEDDRKVYGLED
jgi:hypothetical protein